LSLPVVFRPGAVADLADIHGFISSDSPFNADRFTEAIRQRCAKLGDMPFAGRQRDDITSGLRVAAFRRRVVIAYRVSSSEIQVLRIFYGGRDYEAIMKGR